MLNGVDKLGLGLGTLEFTLGAVNSWIGIQQIESMNGYDTQAGSKAKLAKGILHLGVGIYALNVGAAVINKALNK